MAMTTEQMQEKMLDLQLQTLQAIQQADANRTQQHQELVQIERQKVELIQKEADAQRQRDQEHQVLQNRLIDQNQQVFWALKDFLASNQEIGQSIQESLKDVQKCQWSTFAKVDAMEYRTSIGSEDGQGSMRHATAYASGEAWQLTKANAMGVQTSLRQKIHYYGQMPSNCDKRRPRYQAACQYFADTMPQSEMWSQGYVALRMPEVQEALVAHGVDPALLEHFKPSPGSPPPPRLIP